MIFSKSRLEKRRRGPRILGYAPSRPSVPRVSRRANCLPEKFAEYASEAVRGLYMQLAANMSSPQALLKLPFCVAGLGNGNSDRETLRMKCDASTCCGPVIVGSVIKNKNTQENLVPLLKKTLSRGTRSNGKLCAFFNWAVVSKTG